MMDPLSRIGPVRARIEPPGEHNDDPLEALRCHCARLVGIGISDALLGVHAHRGCNSVRERLGFIVGLFVVALLG